MRSPSRPLALFVAATLTAAALTACGGGDSSPAAQQADPSEPFTPAAAEEEEVTPDTWPLTGLEVAEGESAAQKHPILVTKIDNSTSSSPQVGLSHADLVVEELVEGGITRLAVFFYSDVPDNAGPVRSMRASDIGIVPGDHATVVTSGAAGVTIRRITDAGIPFVSEGGAGTYRDDSRSAPYNLFAHLTDTAKAEKQQAVRPADYLPWGDGSDLPEGKKATTFAAAFSGGHSQPSGASTATATRTPTPTRTPTTSSRPTPCWRCRSRSATPATWTPRATTCPRRTSSAAVRPGSSTTVASSARRGARTS